MAFLLQSFQVIAGLKQYQAEYIHLISLLAIEKLQKKDQETLIKNTKSDFEALLSQKVIKENSSLISAYYYLLYSNSAASIDFFTKQSKTVIPKVFHPSFGFLMALCYSANDFSPVEHLLNDFTLTLETEAHFHTLFSFRMFNFYRGLYFLQSSAYEKAAFSFLLAGTKPKQIAVYDTFSLRSYAYLLLLKPCVNKTLRRELAAHLTESASLFDYEQLSLFNSLYSSDCSLKEYRLLHLTGRSELEALKLFGLFKVSFAFAIKNRIEEQLEFYSRIRFEYLFKQEIGFESGT